MNTEPSPGEVYGRLTGVKRVAIMILGALSGAAVAAMFAVFAQQPLRPAELLIGAVMGGALGLSASLGEKRRKRSGTGPPPSP